MVVGGRDLGFWAGGVVGSRRKVARVVDESRNVIIYYHIPELYSRVMTFEEK